MTARTGDGARPAGTGRLTARKDGRRIAVVLPALDEEATVAPLVADLLRFTTGPDPLVDDVVVVDSGSTDRTVERATGAGARVLTREDVLPDVPALPGKGEAMWRAVVSLGAPGPARADLFCFVDADLVDPHPELVPRLLAPLLTVPGTALVKGFHRRPLGGPDGHDGGRVTELMARPLLAALRPELRHVRQPLGGEYAGTRELLDGLPFPTGYGVDIGLLVDTAARFGVDAVAQADLGVRRHRNRPVHELTRTSREVLATVLDRCGLPDSGAGIVGFRPGDHDGAGWSTETHPLVQVDRPPPGEARAGRPCGPTVPGTGPRGVDAPVAGT